MPIQDWSREDSGSFHNFLQGWAVELCHSLNRGRLPTGFFAMIPMVAERDDPDESEEAGYARRANRVAIYNKSRALVSWIEIVSPGNKDRAHSVTQFVEKVRDFLRKGVHVLFVDLFPPGAHDTRGLHESVWSAWTDEPDDRPADKPLTAASYDAGNPFLAYVEPLAPGDALPEMPLFLEPGVYIPCPLDESYTAAWTALPKELREGLE